AAPRRRARLRIRSPPQRGRDAQGSRAVAPLSEPRDQLPVRVRVRVRKVVEHAKVKSVGIIGAGRLGQAMAQTARRAGRKGVISNSRGPETLTSLVKELGKGVSAGTVTDAAAADVVVLAVPWQDVPKAVAGLKWDGRILIDATNDFDPSDLRGRTSSEVVADLVAPA